MNFTPDTTSVCAAVVAAEAGHLQRIADQAAGFFGQILQVGVHVVVRHHDRVLFLEQALDLVFERAAFIRGGLYGYPGPGMLGGDKPVWLVLARRSRHWPLITGPRIAWRNRSP